MTRVFIEKLMLSSILAGGILLSGCVDEEEISGPAPNNTQSFEVTPRFQLEGLDRLADEVFLKELHLSVSEVRLEPLDEGRDEVVYITKRPMFFHFDLASEETILEGAPISLPHAGEYLVSIRLEPSANPSDELEFKDVLEGRSMRLDGLLALEELSDEPMPLPWKVQSEEFNLPDSLLSKPVNWLPWTYSSQRSTYLPMNNVTFNSEEHQTLVISLDLAQWLEGALDPLQQAVMEVDGELASGSPEGIDRLDAIDVSSDVEEKGSTLESLNGSSEVESRMK